MALRFLWGGGPKDDFPAGHLGRATPGLGSGDQGLKDGPFLTAEVAGVGWACPLRPSRAQDFYDSLLGKPTLIKSKKALNIGNQLFSQLINGFGPRVP